jgi:chromosome segregation ATPase
LSSQVAGLDEAAARSDQKKAESCASISASVRGAAESFRVTDFYEQILPVISECGASVRADFAALRHRTAEMQRECEEQTRVLFSREESLRQRLLHFSPLADTERELTLAIAAEASIADQLVAKEAGLEEALSRLNRANSIRNSLAHDSAAAATATAAIAKNVHELEEEIAVLGAEHNARRAPIQKGLSEAEERASEMRQWRVTERQLRGEMERLETERAALTAAEGRNSRLDADEFEAVTKRVKKAKEEVFFW